MFLHQTLNVRRLRNKRASKKSFVLSTGLMQPKKQAWQMKRSVSLAPKAACTPPPHYTPSSIERKTYKRPRHEDEPDVRTIDESAPLASLTREKTRAAKRLKFEPTSK